MSLGLDFCSCFVFCLGAFDHFVELALRGLNRPHHFKFCGGRLLQILISRFLNMLSQLLTFTNLCSSCKSSILSTPILIILTKVSPAWWYSNPSMTSSFRDGGCFLNVKTKLEPSRTSTTELSSENS